MPAERHAAVDILGCRVDRLTKGAFLREVAGEIRRGSCGKQVVTANVDTIVLALDDGELRETVNSAAFVVADGVPLLWYSRMVGTPIPERINGTDLCLDLAGLAAAGGWRVYLLGSSAEARTGSALALRARHKDLIIAGHYGPPFGPWSQCEEETMATVVRESEADLVLVGLGTPRQESWIRRRGAETRAPILVGVGGSFDILSGRLARAPRTFQRSGLEWLWRLCLEPRRLAHRYLIRDPRFLLAAIRTAHARRRVGTNPPERKRQAAPPDAR